MTEEKYLKWKDLTAEQKTELFNISPVFDTFNISEDLKNLIESRYYYRYLCAPEYEAFKHSFQTVLRTNLYNIGAAEDLFHNYMDFEKLLNTPIELSTSNEGTYNKNVTDNTTGTSTTSGKTDDFTTVQNTQDLQSVSEDNTTQTEDSTRTPQLTTEDTVKDKTTRAGGQTTQDKNTTKDDTTTTRKSEHDTVGVKESVTTPAATFTSKTYTVSTDTPMSTQHTIGMGNSGIKSDVATNGTAGHYNYDNLSSASEQVSYNSLDREENGNYRTNITRETWGQDREGESEPLRESTQETVTTGRAAGAANNTESTGTSTTTYNDITDTREGTTTRKESGSDKTARKVTNSGGVTTTDTGNTDSTGHSTGSHNSTTQVSNGRISSDTGTNSNTVKMSGISTNDRVLLFKQLWDLILSPSYLDKFADRFNICFAAVYEGLDDRRWYE